MCFFFFGILNHFHLARKLFAALCQAQMAALLPVRFQILLMRTIVPEKWLHLRGAVRAMPKQTAPFF